MERAYYLVGDGDIKKAVIEQEVKIVKQREAQIEVLKKLSEEVGCRSDRWLQRGDRCVGIVFDDKPSTSVCGWKKVDRDAWWPKRNTKEGKRISSMFSGFRSMDLSDVLPKEDVFSWKFTMGMVYKPWVTKLGDKIILTIQYDEMKTDGPDVPEYISKQLTRIKAWEFNKEVEDWNESIKVNSECQKV